MTHPKTEYRARAAGLAPQDLPALLGVPLSLEQLNAATAPMAPQLIVAGAGTGKTTVMAARVTWLVATGQVSPSGVLGLTFTNKAAGELRTRIRRALAKVASRQGLEGGRVADEAEAAVMTYHSFAGQLLSEYGLLMGLESGSATLTDGLRSRLAYQVACSPATVVPELSTLARGGPSVLAGQLLVLDDALTDLDVTTAELREFDDDLMVQISQYSGATGLIGRIGAAAGGRIVLSKLVDQYRALKLEQGRQDFADQVRQGSTLAQSVASVPAALKAAYPVVLLDEYQDTSRAQRRTMQALFGSGHPVTAVGDPCQAIYGWRGASTTNIDGFPEHFPNADGSDAADYPLTVNRRSAGEIIDVANRISKNLRGVHASISELRPAPDSAPGTLTCALLETQDDEIDWVVDRVSALCERRDPGDIAILCRTNQQIAAVAAALGERGVPVQIWAKQALLLVPGVQEVLGVLRLLVDPYANPELLSYLTGPRCRIGPKDLSLLSMRARFLGQEGTEGQDAHNLDVSLLDAVFNVGSGPYSGEARLRFSEAAQLFRELSGHRGRPVGEIVELILARLGIPALWASGQAGPDEAAAMAEFLDFASDFESLSGGRSLADFLSYVDDCDRFSAHPAIEMPAAKGRVSVMTVHGSKGLEFPVVVLPFLSKGVFPAARGRSRWPTSATAVPQVIAGEPDPAAEVGFPYEGVTTRSHREYISAAQASEVLDEDRLAYVAATRAEEHLLASGHWWGPTQTKPRGPSPYLLALRHACEANGGEVSIWEPDPPDAESSPCLASPATSVMWPNPTVSAEAILVCDVVADAEPQVDLGESTSPCQTEPIEEPAENSGIESLVETGLIPELDPDSWESRVDLLLSHLSDGPVSVVMPEVMSVSDVVAWQKDREGFISRLIRPMPRPANRAAATGTAFHEWVEQQLGQQTLFESDGSGGFSESVDPGFDPELKERFARTPFADRVPVAVEQSFTVRVGGLCVTGQIDAVFASGSGFEVVDWKTGSKRGADPRQLALYRHAWAQMAGVPLEKVSAAFVFLGTGEVSWHDDLLDIGAMPDAQRLVFES